MAENLVIVESPAKAKTIANYLGKDFNVVSSFGHVRDLSRKKLGIDIGKGFSPEYEVPDEKRKVVAELKKAAASAKYVWIASDEDREGEAIAWHIIRVLGLDAANTRRIVFHEITKEAIERAVANPRQVDMNLVNAQQARRVLDRIVGFEISPVLWKKVQPSLSAGRVQSVAVRLIVEREREVIAFTPESAFRVTARFTLTGSSGDGVIGAESTRRFTTQKEALEFLKVCAGARFTVSSVNIKPGKRSPAPPFITSTLQQEAYRRLGYSVSQTMSVAQRLYEGGKITYMRTDSTNLSKSSLAAAAAAVKQQFGERYSKTRQFRTRSKGAQEAHEAIRPTYPDKESITGTQQEKRLYDLIRKRMLASQMADAEIERTTVVISAEESDVNFTATGEVVKFDGFLRLYGEISEDEKQNGEAPAMPPVKEGAELEYESVTATERFTSPPPRYTEASLVKKLEELGIGRPSTYAPTISTIQNRGYVAREDRPGTPRESRVLILKGDDIESEVKREMAGKEKAKLFPQDIGMIVNDFLADNFGDIIDYRFTATVEEQFDNIAEGNEEWTGMLERFYSKFHPAVEKSLAKSEKKTGERLLGNHPETAEPVYAKMGRYGPIIQIGEASDEVKPRYAGLLGGQLIETITLEEALELFRLPRTVGEHEGNEVIAGIGRFGPFVRYRSKFYSLRKGVDDPHTIQLDRALEVIAEKDERDSKKVIAEMGEYRVLNGRYGPYISFKGKNYRIPSGSEPEKLTPEQCREIVEKGDKRKRKK